MNEYARIKQDAFVARYGTSRVEMIDRVLRNMDQKQIFGEWLLTNDKTSQKREEKLMSRIYIHTAPDEGDIRRNQALEPEGERLRRELTEWLRINKISGILLDTPEHCVDIQIAKLPPNIKNVLSSWGSIYVKDEFAVTFTEEEQPKVTRKFRAAA
jgi:hypothetical protein